MARSIDLGPPKEANPDKVGTIRLRADPRRRTLYSNPDGAFAELRRAEPDEYFFVKLAAYQNTTTRSYAQTRWVVGVQRGEHFMALRNRKDAERGVLCAIYTAILLGSPSVFVDAGDRVGVEGPAHDWVLYMDDERGGSQIPVDISDLVWVDHNFRREGWTRLVIDDPARLRALGMGEVEAEFKRRCGAPENGPL